jgi:hypothetical protein
LAPDAPPATLAVTAEQEEVVQPQRDPILASHERVPQRFSRTRAATEDLWPFVACTISATLITLILSGWQFAVGHLTMGVGLTFLIYMRPPRRVVTPHRGK